MQWDLIKKPDLWSDVIPNLSDYDASVQSFSWEVASRGLDGLPTGGLNIAYEAVLEFRESLPKTRSGKIMRRLLKAEETGAPVGDLSTLAS